MRAKIEGLNTSKPVLSYSKIACYLTCSLKYKFRYIDKIEKKKSVPMIYGIIVHETLEQCNTINIDINTIDEIMGKKWADELSKGDIQDIDEFTPEHLQNMIRQSIKIVKSYLANPERKIPVETEVEVTREFDEYTLIGYVDGFLDGGDTLEYKTSKGEWKEGKLEAELQPDFYGLILNRNYISNYEILIKKKIPVVQHLSIKKTLADRDRAKYIIDNYVISERNKIFVPCRNFMCSVSCEYFDECIKGEWYCKR